jgi:peroxiredoxin
LHSLQAGPASRTLFEEHIYLQCGKITWKIESLMGIIEGKPAPLFTLPDQDGEKVALKQLRGQKVVVYFYPQDDTPG